MNDSPSAYMNASARIAEQTGDVFRFLPQVREMRVEVTRMGPDARISKRKIAATCSRCHAASHGQDHATKMVRTSQRTTEQIDVPVPAAERLRQEETWRGREKSSNIRVTAGRCRERQQEGLQNKGQGIARRQAQTPTWVPCQRSGFGALTLWTQRCHSLRDPPGGTFSGVCAELKPTCCETKSLRLSRSHSPNLRVTNQS